MFPFIKVYIMWTKEKLKRQLYLPMNHIFLIILKINSKYISLNKVLKYKTLG